MTLRDLDSDTISPALGSLPFRCVLASPGPRILDERLRLKSL
jgi:hypothetical protein